MTQYNTPSNIRPSHAPDVEVNTVVAQNRPLDRVRWGPIMAGLFAALSLLALLSVLGMAIGLSAYDPGDRARNFGIGAGVWGAISMLLAFFLGGWLAAKTAAVRGGGNGLLNGAMVWAVAIPLMLYLLAGGAMSAADTAANATNAASNAAQNSQALQGQVDRVISASANAPGGSTEAQQQTSAQDPQKQEDALKAARRSAWGTFISLSLGLAAAAMGGRAGARRDHDDDHHDHGHATVTGTGTGTAGSASRKE